jgi:large subunit ribosomal protein L31
MKENLHPTWFPEARVTCACGNTWTTGSTSSELRTDICSACHPFYTGEQRIVDTEGQVDRFMKRLELRNAKQREAEERVAARTPMNAPIGDFGLNKKMAQTFNEAGVVTVADFIKRVEDNTEEQLLEIPGIGRKVLADLKKAIRARGYELPASSAAPAAAE